MALSSEKLIEFNRMRDGAIVGHRSTNFLIAIDGYAFSHMFRVHVQCAFDV